MDTSQLACFVVPFYEEKDIMHNLSHIKRLLRTAWQIAQPYKHEIDEEAMVYAAYFHGIIHQEKGKEAIIRFLRDQGVPEEKMNRIIRASLDSQKNAVPETLEGKILHDAHLLEGGRTFLIVKSLVTGSLRGQTLEQTIEIIEHKILGKFQCYLLENRQAYEEKEAFARRFIQDLKPYL